MAMYTLSLTHHLIENLTTDHCIEMMKISSTLSSACLLLATNNTTIMTKKRKFDVENVEGQRIDYDDIQYLCHSACQIAAKSIHYHQQRSHRDHRDNQQFGIDHLKNIFHSLLKVTQLVPSSSCCSWSVLNALVTCISEIGKGLVNNSNALSQFKDSVPQQLIILLKAKSSKHAVSFQKQQLIVIDDYGKKETLLRLWKILS